MAYIEHKRRSVLKAISWRILGTLDTFLITFLVTGTFKVALSVSGIEVGTKFLLYFFHERIWNKINYGRTVKEPDYQI